MKSPFSLNNRTGIILFLFAIFVILNIFSWQAKICFTPDEMFYYKSSQTLDDVKNIFGPQYFDDHRFQKPPLFYLCIYLFFNIFGINWFSARLASSIFALCMLLATYFLGKKMFGRKKAFIAIVILSTTALFFRFGRVAIPEMTFSASIVGAIFFFYRGMDEKKAQNFYLAFLLMAIGNLVKGPLSILIPVSTLAIYFFLGPRSMRTRIPWIPGIFIIVAFGMLWIIPGYYLHGEAFSRHLMNTEIIYRLTERTDIYQEGRILYYANKIFFYIPAFLMRFMPWTLIGVWVLWMNRNENNPDNEHKKANRFLFSWIIGWSIIFTLIPEKREHYMLSMFPAVALLFSSFINLKREKIKKFFKILTLVIITGYFALAALVLPLIFIDGVDKISLTLTRELKKQDKAVAVSWRLDPQEVEFYIDKPVYHIQHKQYTDQDHARENLSHIFKTLQKNESFYMLLADEELATLFESYLHLIQTKLGQKVRYQIIDSDFRWRKKIPIDDFLKKTISNPSAIYLHLKNALKEPVYLMEIIVQKDAK